MAVDGIGQGIYHVSSGCDRPVADIYQAIRRALRLEDAEAPLRTRAADDAPTILLDPSRTTRDFGWIPEVGFEEGVARTVEEYARAGVGASYTHLRDARMRTAS
jgi:UDP-glucose 4-epimerase